MQIEISSADTRGGRTDGASEPMSLYYVHGLMLPMISRLLSDLMLTKKRENKPYQWCRGRGRGWTRLCGEGGDGEMENKASVAAVKIYPSHSQPGFYTVVLGAVLVFRGRWN